MVHKGLTNIARKTSYILIKGKITILTDVKECGWEQQILLKKEFGEIPRQVIYLILHIFGMEVNRMVLEFRAVLGSGSW